MTKKQKISSTGLVFFYYLVNNLFHPRGTLRLFAVSFSKKRWYIKCMNVFKGKKITVMGLGLLGGALNDVRYLASKGADLLVTDLKNEKELASSLEKLTEYTNIKYRLGGHNLEDFQNTDMVLQPGNVPLDSPFLLEARKNNIPVYVSESLFAQYAPDVVLAGVTGTRGKTTTTHLLYGILKKAQLNKSSVFLGGNIKNVSTLALLDQVQSGDIVVLELDSWALHGMGDVQRSPQVAVFTTFMPDHLNYYKNNIDLYLADKANIFKFQQEGDVLVVGSEISVMLQKKYGREIKSDVVVARAADVPENWRVQLLGDHNRLNIACAIGAARALSVSDEVIKEIVESFAGVEGRLEFVREYNGVKIYNDTTATTPDATIAGLEALGKEKNIVLIMGGADKMLDMDKLVAKLPVYVKEVVLLSGTGTDKIRENITDVQKSSASTLQDAVLKAVEVAAQGDVILFSPAFASFGMFTNEYDRGEQFNAVVKGLK